MRDYVSFLFFVFSVEKYLADGNGGPPKAGIDPTLEAYPLRTAFRSTTFHLSFVQSRSSRPRSCSRITDSPDFTSMATQQRCERGSSTISTFRMIVFHQPEGRTIRTNKECRQGLQSEFSLPP
jgi:hypothetical protein